MNVQPAGPVFGQFPQIFIAIVLLLSSATAAGAKILRAFSCQGIAVAPRTARGECPSDSVGDMSLSCTGGTPTPDGQPIPAVDLQIFVNPTVDPVGACATRAFGTTNVRVNANSIGIANSPSRRTVLVSPDRFIAPRDTPQTIAF